MSVAEKHTSEHGQTFPRFLSGAPLKRSLSLLRALVHLPFPRFLSGAPLKLYQPIVPVDSDNSLP